MGTDLRDVARQALEALELGYDSAKAEADQFHATMAGYKPHRHAAMDADVQKIAQAITALRAALAEHDKADTINGLEDEFRHNIRQTQDRIRAALEQPEPDYYLLPTNKKEPRPGLVNLEEFPGFLYESPNGWHIGDMKVVKWLLNNREADYWEQFKEGA